ncbi:MAG TPA: ABC transporter ATP-binding protein, partial [Candidatus Binataceae bacterium]|nr:ABC transporter ATP-binding protein [Candidatus Binataceae bacterium]
EEQRSLKFGEALSLLIKSWRFIRPHRTMVALKFLIALASLPVFLLIPWPLKIIIDNVIDGRPLEGMVRRLLLPLAGNDRLLLLAVVVGLLLLGMLLAGTIGDRSASLDAHVSSGGLDQPGITSNQANNGWSLVGGLFGLLEVWITLVLTQRLNQTVRTTVYERFLQAPLRLFADQKIGDAVFRVMYDSAAIGEVLYSGVLSPVLSITMIALTTAVLWEHFRNEPLIPILAAVALPVVTMASFFFGPWLRNQSQRMREQGSAVMAAFEERLAQVHLVRAFGQEERETAAIDVESRSSFTATLKMIVLVMLLLLCVIPVLGLLAAIGVYHLMSEVIANRITLGDVTLLAMYGMMLARPMVALGMVWTWLQAPIAGMRRIHSVLEDLPCESGSPENHYFAGHIQKIQFNDVTVGYGPHSVAVDHLNLCFVSGELAGIAGPSGAGKSTLVNCLPGFLEPSSGEITVNGIDISTISRQTLRKRISLVFQDEALFSATIAENIRYGSPDVSSSAVRRAAEMADAAGFIERLPQGYSTMLGRRGTRLSVGQKQRVAIARALLVESDAVVLDEPTGPLDPAAESRLMITLQQLAKTRLVIVVAHREATLALCDKVYFMTDGHVRASGTHAELIKNCPAYQAYVAVGEPANTNHRVPQL